MRFCTTCGRTYEDDSQDMCPYDGTPLFDMAGGAGGFAEGALPEDNMDAGGLFGSAAPAKPAAPAAETTPEPEEPRIPDPAPEPEPAPIGAPHEPDEPEAEPGPAIADEPPVEAPAQPAAARTTGSLAASDLFEDSGAEVEAPVKPAASAELSKSGPQARAEAVAAGIDLPEADDAASIRIAANIKNAIEEIEQASPDDSADEGDKPIASRISSSYDQLPDPVQEGRPSAQREELEPVQAKRSMIVPVMLVLFLIFGGLAFWFFTMGPGAEQPTSPSQPPVEQPKSDTRQPMEAQPSAEPPKEEQPAQPAVVPPTEQPTDAPPPSDPVQPADPAGVEPAKPVEQPAPKEEVKPKEPAKPKEEAKPGEAPKPKEPSKPKEAKPKEAAPKEEVKPAEEPKEEPKEELDNELEKMMNE